MGGLTGKDNLQAHVGRRPKAAHGWICPQPSNPFQGQKPRDLPWGPPTTLRGRRRYRRGTPLFPCVGVLPWPSCLRKASRTSPGGWSAGQGLIKAVGTLLTLGGDSQGLLGRGRRWVGGKFPAFPPGGRFGLPPPACSRWGEKQLWRKFLCSSSSLARYSRVFFVSGWLTRPARRL